MPNNQNKPKTIHQLIADLCPSGVEYKELGEILSIATGKLNANAMTPNGEYPFFTCAEKPYLIDKYAFDTEAILVSGNGSQVGHINYYKGKFNAYQRTYILSKFDKNLQVKYLLHHLKGYLKEYILLNVKEGSIPYITLPMLQTFKIPIPPLPVQQEIVRILDTFTQLTAELTAELIMRKQQYEYYREKLLTFGDDVEVKSLGEVANRAKGTKITAEQMKIINKEKGLVKIFAGGKTFAMVDFKDIPEKDIQKIPSIIVKSRGIIEFEYYEKPFSHKAEFWSYSGKKNLISTKFLFYYLKMNESYFQNIASKMQMPQIALPDTEKFPIPIPSLAEQERIVGILDKFDALVNDISIGIPAEIKLRQQQYEYYRGKLLDFERLIPVI